MSPTRILVTGANVGLGKDCARQLALKDGVEKVILGCRNEEKAKAAKADLIKITGKNNVFDILIIDVSDLDSVRKAVDELKEPIDGLVMNAGGAGGPDPSAMTQYGVPAIVTTNVLGHVHLVDLLLEQKKLTGSAVFSGSEAARGIPSLGYPQPVLESGSVDEFVSIADGSKYKNVDKYMETVYGPTKMMGALWMSSMARKQPDVRFVTMSPGLTGGTDNARDLPPFQKAMFTMVKPVFRLMGQAHGLKTGAKRYVDALCDEDTYKSGVFYASKKGTSGPVCDQVSFMDIFHNESYQDNCNEALHKFIK